MGKASNVAHDDGTRLNPPRYYNYAHAHLIPSSPDFPSGDETVLFSIYTNLVPGPTVLL